MHPSSIEVVDLIIFAVVVLAVTAWSFHRLDGDRVRAEKLIAKKLRIPWRYRHFPGKSKRDLQADLIGRGAGLFLMLVGFSYLKTLVLSLGYRLAASAFICVLILATIPRLFVAIDRRFRVKPDNTGD